MPRRILFFLLAVVILIPATISFRPGVVFAAANLSIGGGGTYKDGDTVTLSIIVSTSASANAFQGTLSYPAGMFTGIRGSFSGSICTLPISQPDPSDGTATFSCGRPSGFSGTGTVATVTLEATGDGSGSFGLSGCQVLANDGQGTDITGGCSGTNFTVAAAPTPPPATPTPAAQTPTPTPVTDTGTTTTTTKTTTKTSPTPTATPKNTPTPTPSLVPAETPKNVPATPTPTPPPVQTLAPTPKQSAAPQQSGAATTTTQDTSAANSQPRTIGEAIQAILASSKDIKNLHTSPAGVIALMVTTIPFLALVLAILFLGYRLYMMERRRRHTLDRLFEMELSELAALEGKIDLLAEKGPKGREQYKEEFEKAKENILRQLKPGFGKPVEPDTTEAKK